MNKAIILIILFPFLTICVQALQLDPPLPDDSAIEYMPEADSTLGEGILSLVRKVLPELRPDLNNALQTCAGIFTAVVLLSIIPNASSQSLQMADWAGAVSISALLIGNTHSLVGLGIDTIESLSEYGKLFYPVMTTAVAAQGGVTSASAIYLGTAAFTVFLGKFITQTLVKCIYLFLAVSVANCAVKEDQLKRIKEELKKGIHWFLKTVISLFIAYMSITNILSGTADAASVKAMKAAISAAVPVIGNTLSNASEKILVGAALVKNSIGIYGIFAVLAIFLAPFFKIGVHYGILRACAAVCRLFKAKSVTALVEDFTAAMGLLLAMTGSQFLMMLISLVCFLHGGNL